MADDGRWLEIRDPATGKLVFRFDPKRMLLEYRRKGGKRQCIVDLSQYPRGENNDKGS